ncbi:hypothetical protein KMI_04g07150 [Encephalitozoon hellem]|uniref:Uncharacterized protein n=1 Tax=Encephalitozoon hellem TaxID=27973 RepID=A0A9Q9F849_ENCHE|nr:uncharacterized protein EHEL_040880 [Encephalitozoon hellem ATCC 50504]AFM98138.1 hypothetical protein EHEL_040880 [Encephalitozoon hellem ATCC 50504]KAG5859906.1 hypothetical protein KMI_04g07150 [Encephalitozoon hellem]UTX42983.1 hypothetical protein GPU96_04g07160 [Encephalitozoon hellem]WEL38440.1 hypothetical protein PFJ87_04g01140 [Encephalitozoon hellem]|eukprot:XP_003887119.1 hypothetical protein EHEL_040880 [Encephalitozoon hellem ATCC 50504]
MIQLPGDGVDVLTYNGQPLVNTAFPEIGCKARARVVKVTFTQVVVQIFEIEKRRTAIEYRGIFRQMDFDPNAHLCDKFRKGDVVECTILSYGDNGIFVNF